MPRFTKVARHEFPSTEPERRGKIDVAYVYADERFQTVNIRLPLEEDTEENVRRLLREQVERAERAGPEVVEL